MTEFGVQSKPPNHVLGVPLAQQAEFDAISEKIAWENPRVVSFDQYLLRDDPPKVAGLLSRASRPTRASPKPAYDGFRLPLVVTRTSTGVSFWGLVRPFAGEPAAARRARAERADRADRRDGSDRRDRHDRSDRDDRRRPARRAGGAIAASVGTELTIQYSSERRAQLAHAGERPHRLERRLERRAATGPRTAMWRVKWRSAVGHDVLRRADARYTTTGKLDY